MMMRLFSLSNSYNVDTLKRTSILSTDVTTLDPVIYNATVAYEKKYDINFDIVVTLQATSPLLKAESIDKAIDFFISKGYDTVLSCKKRSHLSWIKINDKFITNYKERLNSQYLKPIYEETGGFLITKRQYIQTNNRIGNNVSLFELSDMESLDIDDPKDWWIAKKFLTMKNIIIRVDGYRKIGLGHIYRCITLANLIEHNVLFILLQNLN